jgi:F-type H+-transporting ATPase subunit delta
MVVDKRREKALSRIAAEFSRLAAVHRGEVVASVTSAVELTAAELDAIRRKLGAPGKRVILHETVDSGILGGLVIRIGNKIYDGSVSERVRRLRTQLAQAQVGLQR